MRACPKHPISDDNCELQNLNGMPCTLGKLENIDVQVPAQCELQNCYGMPACTLGKLENRVERGNELY